MSKYAIRVEWPTAKETVEVAGLGVFPNNETTELTDEQVTNWFNRVGGDPLAQFPEGITIIEVQPKVTVPSEPEPSASTEVVEEEAPSEPAKTEDEEPKAEQEEAPAEKSVSNKKKGDA